ncbi:hypothetical protein N9W09_03115 [Crocinitomicaceae bacterium]|nr:hypothetical protein [Crocinitomicaceae bacterium]
MHLFHSNPYRILGIKANASAPEKQKVKSRIAAYIKVGKAPVLDFDLCPPLEQIERTQELIDLKSNEILSDEDKVKHALFWFVSGGTIDDIALSNLTESKNLDKALSNFEKGSKGFAISKSSICSIINHSTLEIICYAQHKDKTRLKAALNRKLDIASSDKHLSILLSFLNPNSASILSNSIKPDIIQNAKLLLGELFPRNKKEKLYSEFFSDQKEIIEEIKENEGRKLISEIKKLVNKCREERKVKMKGIGSVLLNSCADLGINLMNNTKKDLLGLKRIYGVNSMKVANCYEEVFSEVNYCGVGASNKFQDTFGLLFDADKGKAILYVQSYGATSYDKTVNMVEQACRMVKDINTPIRNQLNQNLKIIKETRSDWIGLCNQVAPATRSSGGYSSRASSSRSSSSSSSGISDDAAGCIGMVIVGVVLLIILSNC